VSDSAHKDSYSNLNKIGEGAAGEVFVANFNERNQQVAIKTMTITNENKKTFMYRNQFHEIFSARKYRRIY